MYFCSDCLTEKNESHSKCSKCGSFFYLTEDEKRIEDFVDRIYNYKKYLEEEK